MIVELELDERSLRMWPFCMCLARGFQASLVPQGQIAELRIIRQRGDCGTVRSPQELGQIGRMFLSARGEGVS